MIRKVFSTTTLNNSSPKANSLSPSTSTNLTTRTPQSIPTSATSPSSTSHNLKPKPPAAKPVQTQKKKRLTSFFKRLSIEWQYILFRLRSISEEVFESDEFVEDLFVESDAEETLDRMIRTNKGYNSTEEQFLKDFKKYKSLDNMAEAYSPKENPSDSAKVQTTLQDIIRQQYGDLREGSDDEDLEQDDTEYDISYHDLDLNQLRKEFEQLMMGNSDGNVSSDTDTLFSQSNIGSTLWEYRRSKWLANNHPEKLEARLKSSSIDHIPKDTYVKIYNNLIDKSRQLKDSKRINLKDLIKIINAGWIAQEKWERAGRGLP